MRDTDQYEIEDYRPRQAAGSVEPFARPDYKSKRHPRPAPRNIDCRGRFALRRGQKSSRLVAALEGGAE
jgi:hypothetical protein